jgi:hypothetical protein
MDRGSDLRVFPAVELAVRVALTVVGGDANEAMTIGQIDAAANVAGVRMPVASSNELDTARSIQVPSSSAIVSVGTMPALPSSHQYRYAA